MTPTTPNQGRRLLLIINPISGTDNKEQIERTARERLTSAGFTVGTAYTCAGGDATRLAAKAVENGFYGVVAVGGDGTVNETARALAGTRVALGIIPCGSGNGLARHLGIPLDPVKAIDIIAADHTVDSDYGSVNNQMFFCTFGVGFDAAVSENFARQHRRGRLSYLRSALAEYVKFRPQTYSISANGQVLTEQAFLVAVCNASQYGNNAFIAPGADITDGLLDITIVHAGTPLSTALVGVDLFNGFLNKNTLVHTFRAPSVVIYRQQEGPAHLDGEPVNIAETMEIKCHPRDLRIFTPVELPKFKPIITPMENVARDILDTMARLVRK